MGQLAEELIDWYGYDKLVRFQARPGRRVLRRRNAFETGKLAMKLDGEWRVAFIQHEHPKLEYGTAPLPVDDAHPELYGSGYINGTIIGIPSGGQAPGPGLGARQVPDHRQPPLAELSNGLRNVPTTQRSLHVAGDQPDAHFTTFLKIFANPHSSTSPITASGAGLQEPRPELLHEVAGRQA